jgi:hypothetical protein
MQGLQGAVAEAAAELGELNLPENVELLDVAGTGSRAVTFKARYRGEIVALKVYRPDAVKKYRDKHDLNIAVFEMSRNREFRKNLKLFPFSAKPIMVLGHDGRLSLCFIQEFIDGIPLTRLGSEQGGLPSSVLEAGEIIARATEEAGLHDLDLDYRNVLVRQESGRWLPVIHDFNQVPGERVGMLAGLLKGKPKDNHQLVKEWLKFSEQCGGK